MQQARMKWAAGLVCALAALALAGCTSDKVAAATGAGPVPAKLGGPARLYFLGAGKVFSISPEGAAAKVVLDQTNGARPNGLNDGIALDPVHLQLYWTNMGKAADDDGWVMRANLDGTNAYQVVPVGGAFTPKQIKLDLKHGKMYWSDREGMSIRRANLDGTNIETVIGTGDPVSQKGDQTLWCVGIALDIDHGMVYWTQKGGDNAGMGVIRRAPMEPPRNNSAWARRDIETLFSRLPEPIDMDLDLKSRTMYWTDRGDNTVSRAPMDPPKDYDPAKRLDRQILVRGLKEAIGVAIDVKHNRMAYTDLGGEVGLAKLDGSNAHMLATGLGVLTGITWVQ